MAELLNKHSLVCNQLKKKHLFMQFPLSKYFYEGYRMVNVCVDAVNIYLNLKLSFSFIYENYVCSFYVFKKWHLKYF